MGSSLSSLTTTHTNQVSTLLQHDRVDLFASGRRIRSTTCRLVARGELLQTLHTLRIQPRQCRLLVLCCKRSLLLQAHSLAGLLSDWARAPAHLFEERSVLVIAARRRQRHLLALHDLLGRLHRRGYEDGLTGGWNDAGHNFSRCESSCESNRGWGSANFHAVVRTGPPPGASSHGFRQRRGARNVAATGLTNRK